MSHFIYWTPLDIILVIGFQSVCELHCILWYYYYWHSCRTSLTYKRGFTLLMAALFWFELTPFRSRLSCDIGTGKTGKISRFTFIDFYHNSQTAKCLENAVNPICLILIIGSFLSMIAKRKNNNHQGDWNSGSTGRPFSLESYCQIRTSCSYDDMSAARRGQWELLMTLDWSHLSV